MTPSEEATPLSLGVPGGVMHLTPKQEAFVLAYIETGNASEAYRRAYPKAQEWKSEAVHVKASEMLTNGKVAVRVAEEREKHAKRHEVTVDSLMGELEEARALALETKTPGAAVSATMGKAKLLGLIVDKNEHTGKDGGPIETADASPRDEFARRIAGVSSRLGEGKAPNGPNGSGS